VAYEGFEIPKCLLCGKPSKYKSGLFFRRTCGEKECVNKIASREQSLETRQKSRESHLRYMKEHPENTAWRKSNQLSWPEKIFMNGLYRNSFHKEFEIEREKSFFPFFVDFAFLNVKVAVEINGSQHNQKERKKSDVKKKKVILKSGWRLYTVTASQVQSNMDDVLAELRHFIGSVHDKAITSEIKTESEKKRELRTKRREEIKRAKLNLFLLRKKDYDKIEKDWGYVNILAKKWEVSWVQAGRYIRINRLGEVNSQ
jgi:very-short-patch-repair endonuclease